MNLGQRCKRPATNRLSRGQVEGKCQVVRVHVIKAYEGKWIRAPFILYVGAILMHVITPRRLYHIGKRPRYPLNGGLGQVPSRVVCYLALYSNFI